MQELVTMFHLTKGSLRVILRSMDEAMANGLCVDGGSKGIRMIPTHIYKRIHTGYEEGLFLGLDIGATNFALALLTLKKGEIVDSKMFKELIPKEKKQGTGDDLFDFCVDVLLRVFESEWQMSISEVTSASLTFSFPVNQTSPYSGTLIRWTKEFSATGVEGHDVIKLFNDALQRKSVPLKITALINNTVGTLISKFFVDPTCNVGLIVGTGFFCFIFGKLMKELCF